MRSSVFSLTSPRPPTWRKKPTLSAEIFILSLFTGKQAGNTQPGIRKDREIRMRRWWPGRVTDTVSWLSYLGDGVLCKYQIRRESWIESRHLPSLFLCGLAPRAAGRV